MQPKLAMAAAVLPYLLASFASTAGAPPAFTRGNAAWHAGSQQRAGTSATPTGGSRPAWQAEIERMHAHADGAALGSGMGLSARDFGAVGDGVCTEAPDRSWTRCAGTDDAPALQRAMDEALKLGRALLVPAGVYMVNSTLIIRKPSENATIKKPQPWLSTGLRVVGEGIGRTVIVAQCAGGAGCMEAVILYEGNEREPDLLGVTQGHSMESLSVSAAGLATHGILAPAVIWSRWFRVGVFDALDSGMRLLFGFCLRIEECSIGSNPGANLIGIHAMADINNLDIVNSFFHGSHQFAGIVISGGMQVQDDEFLIQNDEFCIQIDMFCI